MVPFFLIVTVLVPVGNLRAGQFVGQYRLPGLVRVERALYEGRLSDAARQLDSIQPGRLPAAAGLWYAVLTARLQHDQGDPPGALHSLQALMHRIRANPACVEVQAEALLEQARIYRTLFWFDTFNRANDSAGMLIRHFRMSDHLTMRYQIHRGMYMSMVLFHFKAKPYLDTMQWLLSRATAADRYLYQPALAVSVRLNWARNAQRDMAFALKDSLWGTFDQGDPLEESYDRIAMWRAVANAFLDDIAGDNNNPDYRLDIGQKALRCFDRALKIQASRFPHSMADRVTLLDLKSLVFARMRKHGEALNTLHQADRILQSPKYADSGYYYLHYMTAQYTLYVMDSALKGDARHKERMRMLDRWDRLESGWAAWERRNLDSLGHYRFHYTSDPGAVVAMLCYDIYREHPDAALLNRAFLAQERSKYRPLRNHWKHHYGLQEPLIPSLWELQKQLSKDEALISATDAGIYNQSTHILAITTDTIVFFRIPESRLVINQSHVLDDPAFVCKDVQQFQATYHRLWQLMFREMEPYIRHRKNLTIWPSGFLSSLNLELMIYDTTGVRDFRSLKMMRDKHRFWYDHSWSIAQMRKQLPGNSTKERAVFIPDYTGTSMYRLRFFEQMGAGLAARHGFKVFDGREASVDRFMREAPSAGILQVAAHGYSDRMIPGDQYILMDSLSAKGYYRLTPFHLYQMDIQAELAVLSICMGGIAEWSHQNPRNLAYWFSWAGVHTCVYTHWKLDDRSTARIMERFYTYLEQGENRYEALRKAQNDHRNSARTDEELNPIYWAGLTIMGEDGPVDMPLTVHAGKWIHYLFAGLLLFVLFIIVRHVQSKRS